ncbi:hypothetical protein CDEST_06289 [Colletotrichum destructivum]|uniref:Uncharacterized protein n=1 Tax=Colletotrichum destructivum TaxID=34406 RepID=A0AAX4IDD7_9PEZI|nr:hypothetical protein CDEST_06289 [Colletotrichum destructivum]
MNSICAGGPLHCRSQARLLFSCFGFAAAAAQSAAPTVHRIVVVVVPLLSANPRPSSLFPKGWDSGGSGVPQRPDERVERVSLWIEADSDTLWADDMKPAECEGLAAWEEVSSQHGMGNTRLGFQCF